MSDTTKLKLGADDHVVGAGGQYVAIDVSAGPAASSYPVTYLATLPTDLHTNDVWKTTTILLRRVPAGTFVMGSPTNELGRNPDETQHQVTLTKDFYIGVFEITQRQWERVMNAWPSQFNNVTVRDSRPVEQVSYNDIRGSSAGAGWPANSAVDATSFLGKLRQKSGVTTFDLPTESQWEYACRAGTTTALNNGTNLVSTAQDSNADLLERYWFNGGLNYLQQDVGLEGGTAKVGSYQPNAWGLYDMHGNGWEWCLDWYYTYPGTVTDPVGPATGSYRAFRGGAYGGYAYIGRSARRYDHLPPSDQGGGNSFRLALPEGQAWGGSAAFRLDTRERTVAFALSASSVAESVGTAALAVNLSLPAVDTTTVAYDVTGGTATGGGVDYTLVDGTLTFQPGEISLAVNVAIANDALTESAETVQVTLSNPTNATLGATTVHTLTITDEEADGLSDDWEQHYFGDLDEVDTGDPDGDSFTNAQEFAIGTDPTDANSAPVYSWTNFVGQPGGEGNADGMASLARFLNPDGVAVDSTGNLFVTDYNNHTIRKITPWGVVTTIAGLAGSPGSADGTGSAARFHYPRGVTVDSAGNVYVADEGNDVIRKVTAAGVVTTLAASSGGIGVAVDSAGTVYVASPREHIILKVTPGGTVTILAGWPGISGSTDGTGNAARFDQPSSVAVDSAGTVYVGDSSNHAIRKVTSAGEVTTFAAGVGYPAGVAVNAAGMVFVTDGNYTILQVTPEGVVTTLAGDAWGQGYADGTGASARFDHPRGLAADSAGNVFVADWGNNTIRKVTSAGVVTTLVTGSVRAHGSADGTGRAARFSYPRGLTVDSAGNVYVADFNNCTIRKVTPAGVTTTLAGSVGAWGSADGTGSAARFAEPWDVAVDSAGNLFVADYFNNTIRKVTPAGVVTTLAGTAGVSGNADGTGGMARFSSPTGVAVDGAGNVYVADSSNHAIRKITSAGEVTTLAGSGGGLSRPNGVAVDSAGTVYVADVWNHTILKVTPAGLVTTLAGSAGVPGSADGTGSAARFYIPAGVAVDNAGNVYVADSNNCTIRKVTPAGVVTTIGGSVGVMGGADGVGVAAIFACPTGVAMDSDGNLFVVDPSDNRIIKGTLIYPPPSVAFAQVSSSCAESAGTVYLPVTLDAASDLTVTVDYAVTGGTATGDGVDYTVTNDTLTFNPGETSKDIVVTIQDDAIYEPDETIEITLSSLSNAVLSTPTVHTFTILNDDNRVPVIAESDSQAVAVDEDSAPVAFNLTLHATDPDGDAITWSILTPAGHGAATADGTGTGKVIGYTPLLNWNGTDSFVVQVTDGLGGTDTITVNVTVNARNDAPANTVVPSVSGAHHFGQVLTVGKGTWTDTTDTSVSGASTLTYSYQWQRADSAAGANAANIDGAMTSTYALTLADNGKYVCVVVTATDDGVGLPETQSAALSTSWTLVANAAPVIAQGDGIAVTMDEDGNPAGWSVPLVSADDADNDTLTWSKLSGPSHGTALVNGTGASPAVLTYAPNANWSGNDSFVVQVSDGLGGTDTITVDVTVNPVNDAPVLDAIGNKQVNEQALLTFTATATDLDLPAQTLTFSLDQASLDAGMTITSGGALAWTPTEAHGGTGYAVTVTVMDNGANPATLTDAETFTITVNEVNRAPVLGLIGDKAVDEQAALTFTAAATDPDLPAQALTFSLDAASLGMGMTITAGGAFSWAPTEAQGGMGYAVTVTVTDNGGDPASLTDSETFTITVSEVNVAPVLTDVPATATIDELAAYTFDANATDTDVPVQALTFTLINGPVGAVLDPVTGVFTWTPAENQGPAGHTFTVSVSDGVTNTDHSVTLTVSEVNVAPVIGGNDTVSVTCDEDNLPVAFSLALAATDADDEGLEWSIASPAQHGAAGIDQAGVVSYTPADHWSGTDSFVVKVTDGLGGTDMVTVNVTVRAYLPPTVSLSMNKASIAENGGTATLTVSLSTPSQRDVTVSLDFSGTATLPTDYTASATQVVIAAGGDSGQVTLTSLNDSLDEPAETIHVSLGAVVNATAGVTPTVDVSITDQDATLTVTTARGTPTPDAGTQVYDIGTVVTCSMAEAQIAGAAGQRFLLAGWTGTGDIPPTGMDAATRPTTLMNNSSIIWSWQTQWYLDVGATGDGTVNAVSAWFNAGSTVTLAATASGPYWRFVGWTGDVPPEGATTNPLSLTMNQARTVTANFTDNDVDGDFLPDDWEREWLDENIYLCDGWGDEDSDGFNNYSEWRDGTDPWDPQSMGLLRDVYDGHYYQFISGALTWDDAQTECLLRGGHLATAADADENGFTYGLVSTTVEMAWLGGTDRVREGTWKWDQTFEAWSFTAWKTQEPANVTTTEDYLVMNGPGASVLDHTRWSALPKDSTLVGGFICEWDIYTTDDVDGDGLPDTWEVTWFGDLRQGPGDDPDGDTYTNLIEYQNGTNPLVPNSKYTVAGTTWEGTMSGLGAYFAGQTVTLTATHNTSPFVYEVDQWRRVVGDARTPLQTGGATFQIPDLQENWNVEVTFRCVGGAPQPNPPVWGAPPAAVSKSAISMTAGAAQHPLGVEYCFRETTTGASSGWVSAQMYEFGALQPGTTYSFAFKSRGAGGAVTETGWSEVRSARTLNPAPPTLQIHEPDGVNDPAVNGQFTIQWTATSDVPGATVAFYIDADDTGYPTQVVAASGLAFAAGSYAFATDYLSGNRGYYVWGEIDDGYNPPVRVYSPGVFSVPLNGQQGSSITCTLAPDQGSTIAFGRRVRVQAQIDPAASAVVEFRFTSPDSTTTTLTALAGSGGLAVAEFVPSVAGAWSVSSKWDGNSVCKGADSTENPTFTVQPGAATLAFAPGNPLQQLGQTRDLAGLLGIAGGNDGVSLAGVTVTLTVKKPGEAGNGADYAVTCTGTGHFLLTDLMFDAQGEWQVRAVFAGNTSMAGAEAQATIQVVARPGYVILCQGRLPNGEGLDDHARTLAMIYENCTDMGLAADDIMYLGYDADAPGVDGAPSEAALGDAIKYWARDKMNLNPAPLFVVLVNHGGVGAFHMNHDALTPPELDGLLDDLALGLYTGNGAADQKIVVVFGTCHSGSFVSKLSNPNRIIVASADTTEVSHRGTKNDDDVYDGDYFASTLFAGMAAGKNLRDSFVAAAAAVKVWSAINNNDSGQGKKKLSGDWLTAKDLGAPPNSDPGTGYKVDYVLENGDDTFTYRVSINAEPLPASKPLEFVLFAVADTLLPASQTASQNGRTVVKGYDPVANATGIKFLGNQSGTEWREFTVGQQLTQLTLYGKAGNGNNAVYSLNLPVPDACYQQPYADNVTNYGDDAPQHALLDDDGVLDANGNGRGAHQLAGGATGDGAAAANIYLGARTNAATDLAVVSVAPSVFLPDGVSGPDLWAVFDRSPGQVLTAWIEVKSPEYTGPEGGAMQFALDLPTFYTVAVQTHPDGSRWTWNTSTLQNADGSALFAAPGAYQVFYYGIAAGGTQPVGGQCTWVFRGAPSAPPETFGLLWPLADAVIPPAAVFQWEASAAAAAGEVRYVLRLWQDAERSALRYEGQPSTARLTLLDSQALKDGESWWDVVAVDAQGNATVSAGPRKLTVNSGLAMPCFILGAAYESESSNPLEEIQVTVTPARRGTQVYVAGNLYVIETDPGTYSISITSENHDEVNVDDVNVTEGTLRQDAELPFQGQTFEFAVTPGWNLISLPIDPYEHGTAALLVDRDTGRMLAAGPVWGWNGVAFDGVSELEPLQGYWVYCPVAGIISVRGTAITNPSRHLHAGWNLVGTTEYLTPPESQALRGEFYGWSNAEYQSPSQQPEPFTGLLRTAFGYWIHVVGETDVDLGP
ncbi:MAG: hypothetical protein A3K18_12010 [Lentisphaerae bacterium RIFOXYA12_64_32]|nr:MAG: hypothetical protein A3K18_12010 [Lentisphaerae bacterium RIFOXYA12_64_32]